MRDHRSRANQKKSCLKNDMTVRSKMRITARAPPLLLLSTAFAFLSALLELLFRSFRDIIRISGSAGYLHLRSTTAPTDSRSPCGATSGLNPMRPPRLAKTWTRLQMRSRTGLLTSPCLLLPCSGYKMRPASLCLPNDHMDSDAEVRSAFRRRCACPRLPSHQLPFRRLSMDRC